MKPLLLILVALGIGFAAGRSVRQPASNNPPLEPNARSKSALEQVFSATDPIEFRNAYEELESLAQPKRLLAQRLLLIAWARKDPEAALEFLSESDRTEDQSAIVIEEWSRTAPTAAIDGAIHLGTRGAITAALRGAGSINPESASNELVRRALPDHFTEHLQKTIQEASTPSPETDLPGFLQVVRDSPDDATSWLLIQRLGYFRLDATVDYFHSLPDDHPQRQIVLDLIANLQLGVERFDTDELVSLVAADHDGNFTEVATWALANRLAESDPQSGLKWIEGLDPKWQKELRIELIKVWAERDLDGASAFLESIPAEETHWEVLASPATQEKAAEWLEGLDEDEFVKTADAPALAKYAPTVLLERAPRLADRKIAFDLLYRATTSEHGGAPFIADLADQQLRDDVVKAVATMRPDGFLAGQTDFASYVPLASRIEEPADRVTALKFLITKLSGQQHREFLATVESVIGEVAIENSLHAELQEILDGAPEPAPLKSNDPFSDL